MSESEGDKTGEGEARKVNVFSQPRHYPFRDYASIRRAICDNALTETRRALDESIREVGIIKRQYQAKCVELARIQRENEWWKSTFHDLREDYRVVLRENQGSGKPSGGRSATSWGARLLAKATSLLRR